MPSQKTFLFLQGPPNRYWSRLAQGLSEAGQTVLKINFCLADQVFWRVHGSENYRGKFSNWQEWLAKYVREHGVTDIIYYADQHPYHVVAHNVAAEMNVKCWAIEFGYLRPDWLTMEEDGMGPLSHFPRSRSEITDLARNFHDPDMTCRYPHKFIHEAAGEVVFHLLQSLGRPLFPFFKSDKTYWPIIDYLSWLPEFLRGPKQDRHVAQVENRFINGKNPFWLVALQIHADYQIRSHSPFDHQEQMLAKIFNSFAKTGANGDLVIKTHPLDNGFENWPKRVKRQAEMHGLTGRVHLIKGGDLGRFIDASKGVVLANSTVGLHSIAAGLPTITMGDALYDIDGLTHQSGLDEFWLNPQYPDKEFAKTYRRALMAIQVKGSFYNCTGRDKAASEMVQRLTKPFAVAKNPLQRAKESLIIAAE